MPNELAQGIFGTPSVMAFSVLILLTSLLLTAAWTDLRRQRIPNWLVFGGSVLALLLHTALPAGDGFLSALPGGLGFPGSIKGLAFGLLALLPLYWLRTMGAGDVKLMAMVGAFLGPVDIWWVLLLTLFAGGALAIAVALYRGVQGNVLQNLQLMSLHLLLAVNSKHNEVSGQAFVSAAPLPYGVAIAIGSMAWVVYRARLSGLL